MINFNWRKLVSVTNIYRVFQCAQFLRRAHFCKKTGGRKAFYGNFCDLVHIRVIDMFAKQLNNALNVPKCALNHKNTGKITKRRQYRPTGRPGNQALLGGVGMNETTLQQK